MKNGIIFAPYCLIFQIMTLRISFIVSALFLISSLKAQKISVISASDRAPIEHVAVFNNTRESSSITDSLGIIELSIFGPSDTIIFQHPSFLTIHIPMKNLRNMSKVALERKNVLIDEFVISASKYRESKVNIPYMVDVLEESTLRESTGLTAADILEGTGNIMVQRTQGGGGSPVLRGFEANKILLVVDGVRLNNAIYRSGHLQNSITIDHSILHRTEVIFGPTSIIYGSDALGGVIHYYTKDPRLAVEKSSLFEAGAYTQFTTANKGFTGHLDFSLGKKRWASLSSVTYKNFGDIKMGSRRDPTLGDWGKRMHYVEQIDGVDSVINNPDPRLQKNTGYRQVDILQKIRYTPSQYVDWILNLQYSTSSDIDRLDKLNDYSGENLKYAEYYYGPQNRLLASLKNVLKKDNLFFTNMTNILAFQRIDEDRYSRKIKLDELLTQKEDVMVFSLNTDLLKVWSPAHKLNYGLELNYNQVASEAWYAYIDNGELSPAQTRYPEGGSHTWNASAYASYKWIIGEKGVLNGGARYSRAGLSSTFTAGILPYDQIQIDNGALTGSLGFIYTPTDKWQFNIILSSGFRNPNVDDFGKVRAKDDYITVPNADLSPEYSYNAEIGISRVVEGYIKFELVGYYSYLKDAIVRTAYQINGEDSLLYDGDYYDVTANYNAAQGMIYGGSLRLTANLNRNISMNGTLNYTHGQNITDNVPLGHIPPIFGRTSLTYRRDRFFFDIYAVYQGWKDREDFSPYGEDNDGEAMEYGYPSWWTLNLKTGFNLGQHIDLLIALENILDEFYKPHASGISAPGRNLIFTVRFNI